MEFGGRMLNPIINKNTDIFFIPLNPPETSSRLGHYFACNSLFWDSLFYSDVITEATSEKKHYSIDGSEDYVHKIDDQFADDIIFRTNKYNYKHLVYSIRDIVPDIIEGDSKLVEATAEHSKKMLELLQESKPKIALLLHAEARNGFIFKFLRNNYLLFNDIEFNNFRAEREKLGFGPKMGPYGKIVKELDTFFYCIHFPSKRNNKGGIYIDYWKAFKKFLDEYFEKNKE